MGRKNSFILPALILAAIPIVVIAILAWLGHLAYQREQALLGRELAALPVFDEADAELLAEREAAAELGISLPVPAPSVSPEELRAESRDFVAELVRQEFSAKNFSAELQKINRQYRAAEIGDEVTLQLKSNETISGKYLGRESTNRGVFIKVDLRKFRLDDIAEEYHHIFDKALAEVGAREKISEFRENFEQNKRQRANSLLEKELEKRFTAAHYRRDDRGQWRAVSELHAERSAEIKNGARAEFAAEREEQIQKIIEKHRLFGIFPVAPPEKTLSRKTHESSETQSED